MPRRAFASALPLARDASVCLIREAAQRSLKESRTHLGRDGRSFPEQTAPSPWQSLMPPLRRGLVMSMIDYDPSTSQHGYDAVLGVADNHRPLHQLGVVRRREGLSRRAIARRLGTDVRSVRIQEEQTTDLPLSELYRWQAALGVPVSELLADSEESLSPPVMKRAQMLRLMKTVAAIRERAHEAPIRRMVQMLAEQILEVMPELKDVSPWNAVGQRRSLNDLGQAAYRRLSLDALQDLLEQ